MLATDERMRCPLLVRAVEPVEPADPSEPRPLERPPNPRAWLTAVVVLVVLAVVGCSATTQPRHARGAAAPHVTTSTTAPAVSEISVPLPPAPRAIGVDDPAVAAAADAVTDAAMAALRDGAFDRVVASFDPTLGTAPTSQSIAQAWAAKSASLGAVVRWRIIDRTRQDGFATRSVLLELERGAIQCLLSLVPDTHRIASLYLAKPAPPARYVDPSRFVERALVVGAGTPFPLAATLTVPVGAGPFPAVVLVHGSGPNDRDATVGAIKIFKDLAEGLATAGIATLRYEKRTFRYAPATLAIDTEVVDDAVAAVALLRAQGEVDRTRVVVVGHSLGGLLAPEIATRAGRVAGVVLLAPPARPPWDIILGQMRYLRAPAATIKAIELAITVINIGHGDHESILGIPFAYWRDWASRDGVATARRLGAPVLVLRGDRDYQVLAEDFAIWRAGLAGVAGAELATLTGDNHLFVRGAGAPTPLEYKVPAHVDERAVARIAAFVLR